MKRPLIILSIGIILTGGLLYSFRMPIRDWWEARNAPVLPQPTHKIPVAPSGTMGVLGQEPSPIEGGVATSENYALVTNPPKPKPAPLDPLEAKEALPAEVNLDVPFASQAPHQNWDMPYQEACEEASAIMVDAYYRGLGGIMPINEVDRMIKALVVVQERLFGTYLDTSAVDTVTFIKDYFKYDDVRVLPLRSVDDIKRAVANGYPVIIPADGKTLPNPNFRNGGPLYHMFVVKGYTKDRFITNDPGTRKGKDFTYTYDAIMNSAHDWAGTAATGPAVMIVIMPRSK